MSENLPRILVVDDQLQNRLLISEYLEPLNVSIDEAPSGKACLEMLKNKPYNLVVLDVQMPDLDGFEVLERMRQDKDLEKIPVVFVSAIFDSEEYIIKGIEKGAIDFITKPVNINILQSKVNNFLRLFEKQNALDRLVNTLETINKRLEDSEKRFKRITQSAKDAIIVLDKDYNVRFWNKAANKIFGFSRYEILFEDFFKNAIAPQSHRLLKELIENLHITESSMQHNTIRLHGKHKCGTEFPIELSLAHFATTANEINYTMVIRDITQRVAMEKEALKAKELRESNRVMKDFIDSVSHELRTPMNAILGISNMLLKYNTENLLPKQLEGLEIISQSGSRLLEMINDVLDLSRLDANRVVVNNEDIDLDKFLTSIHSLVLSLINEKDIKFNIRKSANVPQYINTDQKKLSQILTNLLGNSVKFTHKGKISVLIHLISDKLYFEVYDTGIGIENEYLEEIFDKFRQIDNSATKEYKGTGLGLNICKKLVELMGGEIRAESKSGEGTTMKFYLPYKAVEKNETARTVEGKTQSELVLPEYDEISDNRLALIIDNNQEQQFWYSNILKNKNILSISCLTSDDAQDVICRYLPDLLILKMEMPKVHGHSILKIINGNNALRKLPVLAITSVSGMTITGVNNPFILLHEPVSELKIQSALRDLMTETWQKANTAKLILYETDNRLKAFINDGDECFYTQSFASARLILARRKVHTLLLDGIDLAGENYKLLKWMSSSKADLPERIIVVSENPFKLILGELQKIPGHGLLPLSVLKNNSTIEEAIAASESFVSKLPASESFTNDE